MSISNLFLVVSSHSGENSKSGEITGDPAGLGEHMFLERERNRLSKTVRFKVARILAKFSAIFNNRAQNSPTT